MKTTNFQTKPDADSERQPAITVSKVEGTGSHIYVVGISLVAAIGGFLFGFDSGVVNGTVHALSVAFGTQAAATGFAVASVLLGCAVGRFRRGHAGQPDWAPPGHVNQRRSLSFERVRIRRRWFSRRFLSLQGLSVGWE
jgi:hypothetical protein